jgi:capsular exopolysaccharide synthesis family protein
MPEHFLGRALPAPSTAALPAPEGAVRAGNLPEPEPEDGRASLAQSLWILKRHRWKILAFVAAVVAATLIISSRLTPLYESTATVDIDRRMPTGILGQEAMQPGTNDSDQFLATQVKLVQSDSVLRPVVQRFKLIEAGEVALPDQVKSVEAEDAPVVLKRLAVTRPPNTYLLLIRYRSANRRLAADVANAIAQSYLEHTYNIRYRSSASLSAFMEKQLEGLRAKMEQSSAALGRFERELNVINPEEKTNILSARLLQLNTEHTAAQADRVRKQAAFYSVQGGSLEAAQVFQQGEALRKIAERVEEAEARFADVKVRYGENHPEYRKAAAQLAEAERLQAAARVNIARRVEIEYRQAAARESMLRKAVAETKAEFDSVNARSFEYQALKREAEADRQLYQELVRKIKEAGINSGFQNSAIRIADPARPALKPVFPNLPLNLSLALALSTLLAAGVALLSDALDNTVRDSDQVARVLKTEVIGHLPMVRNWRGRLPALAPPDGHHGAGGLVLASEAHDRPYSGYEEAIRTLRNSILLSDFDRSLRSLLITSAGPAEGKSTIVANLAVAHAQQGHRTLLIDADLRRPSLHRRFQVPGTVGLSSVLLSELPWREALVRNEWAENLALLPAGPPSRHGADLIGRALGQILDEAASDYDLVIVDAPPLLGFAEPLEMAAVVDGVIVVARAGQTERKAVGSVMAMLHRLRANVLGVVLNEVHKGVSESYHYYGYYGKYYRRYKRYGDEGREADEARAVGRGA